ncbi:phenylalanyl-tRNA synthetase beta subunit [Geothermobacter ehrlichii]|uniref:Phenylalanine--tRNA ligase beta subunit n=1 Tax=Geothermobacter ehrlichii TaxID=213224 RepID=A0A5D3WPK2_9BACT|nr:phenylalanine--tRNA ligase subunit beta [Geothermobacter ehrlichii]TYP00274.1 phenylalanyl-tRNA synthetase beta subunit [Geothermobacter ehrlichii]
MIVTTNWLREFVDFDGDAADLAHRLTMAGLEVESVDHIGQDLDSVIVARLITVDRHPDADRLTVCRVDTGSEELQIVCGATNHRAGDLVALAQVGSVLPGNFKIKKSKIRGQVSMGMLCSEKELGLSEEASGIMILPEGLEPGRPVFEALGLKDTRLEIGLTPNRPDCLSVIGVAREVAALYGRKLKFPSVSVVEQGPDIGGETSVTIEEPEHCPRYMARLIRGAKIGPSPQWLVRRLESVGLRSVNNVVDITNLVMLELGQPMHAFDFNLLRGGRIVVRRAEEGSRFTTLDGQERLLKGTDLVICDGEGPVALAGIMGGENSEIREETTDILLESAYFRPTTVRRTSKRLGIHTESSHRFERGTDIEMVPVALDRAAALVVELAGGIVCRGSIDAYPRPFVPARIDLSSERCRDVLGIDLDTEAIRGHLESIGVATGPAAADGVIACTVPSFRPDLEREIDLVEEVARLAGYDRIPVTMPETRILASRPNPLQNFVRGLRDQMVASGFSEVINYSFISPAAFDQVGLAADDSRRDAIAILNPLTEEQSVMRTTLVPSLLQTVTGNLAYRSLDLRLFELRPVFLRGEGEEHAEPCRLTAVMTGRRSPLGWASDQNAVDFYDLKGVVERVLSAAGVENAVWLADGEEPYLHPGKSARIVVDGELLGTAGEVHPVVQEKYGLEQVVYLFELDVEVLRKHAREGVSFRELSRFPDLFRDTAILVDEEISASRVLEVVKTAIPRFAEDIVLFDLYCGKGVPEGKKSLAFRVRYRSKEGTLTDEEINRVHDKIVRRLEKDLGAQIR